MRLNHLSLTNFRNYSRLDVETPAGVLLIMGENAQGKTSLLEALYFLATFVSYHAGHDRELVNFIAAREALAVTRIVADYTRETGETGAARSTEHRLEVRLIQENTEFNGTPRLRKEILLDGVKHKLSELVGHFNAVQFLPHSLRVIEGAPEERRRYLNLTLAQVVPHYAATLSHYNRTLSQRNALLKQLFERRGDAGQLDYWDEQLAGSGARLIYARIQAVHELGQLAGGEHHRLSHGDEVLRLAYEPAYDPLGRPDNQYTLPLDAPVNRSEVTLDQIHQGFIAQLERLRREEINRGVTTIGPHRDDLRFLANRIDLGTYGSRGQVRTAMLALKLAEVEWMRQRTARWPVLLLDEVLAELDIQRREHLLDRLLNSEQAFLTTTEMDLFTPRFVERAQVWHVHGGQLCQTDQ